MGGDSREIPAGKTRDSPSYADYRVEPLEFTLQHRSRSSVPDKMTPSDSGRDDMVLTSVFQPDGVGGDRTNLAHRRRHSDIILLVLVLNLFL